MVGVFAELADGGQIGQGFRLVEEVVQGDERVGLATTVGHLELADRLGAPASEPGGDVPDEVPEGVGGVGEREELRRVLVDGAASGPGDDLVEVGGELGQGELA